jgi:hypothetical protein
VIRWEYRYVRLNLERFRDVSVFDRLVALLNEFGVEGWEVIQMERKEFDYGVLMKRQVAR